MDNKYWSEKAGGSVFISHCHKDLPSVRMIRNRMEEEGFEPICFYLKCLTDESEIDSLIKREIDASLLTAKTPENPPGSAGKEPT